MEILKIIGEIFPPPLLGIYEANKMCVYWNDLGEYTLLLHSNSETVTRAFCF